MAKEKWGVKRQCLSCGARFYDLKKNPIVCPKCETVFDPESLLKPKRWQGGAARQDAKKEVPKEPEPKDESNLENDDTEEENLDDDGAGGTLLADDDEDEDMSDVFTTPAKSPGSG